MIDFDTKINRIGTYSTQWDFIEDRFGRNDLLPFTISDTDFVVPEQIYEAVLKRANHKVYGYTRWNNTDYKEAIVFYFRNRKNIVINSSWIVYSPTVLFSIAMLLQFTTDKGANIVTFNPMYDAFPKVIKNNDRILISSNLDYNNQNAINFNDLEDKLKTAQMLLLCSPHNPTGKVFSKDELEKIIELCEKYDIWLISDEIHSDVLLHNSLFTTVGAYMKRNTKIILVSSASKTFNTPGLGGSYALISNEALRERFLHVSKDVLFTNQGSILGIEAVIHGYKECDDYVTELIPYIESNMDMLKSFFDMNYPDVVFHIPQATYLAWIDVTAMPFSMDQIQKALTEIGKVAIMDGSIYNNTNEKFLRLNAGCSKAKIQDGINRIKIAFDFLYK